MRDLPEPIDANASLTALAPMQDVTTLPFMQVVAKLGAPDYFVTEYFRVHEHSTLEPHILESIVERPGERPVFAQLIGENIEYMTRAAGQLQAYPIAGVDINMGCPAPKVFKKNVGGGLLRDPAKIDELLGALREVIPGRFTVKMRVGFEDKSNYAKILSHIEKHSIDMLSVHGRTVRQMYRGEVDYDGIKQAVESVSCPVFANGNVSSYEKGAWVKQFTGCAGLMIGRSAIRNPWIFAQIRADSLGQEIPRPTMQDLFAYVELLWDATLRPGRDPLHHVSYMKKFLNFVGQSVDAQGAFLKAMRRAQDKEQLFAVCKEYFLDGGRCDELYPLEPYENVFARPNCE